MNGVKIEDLKIIREKLSNNDKIKYKTIQLNDSVAVRIKVNTLGDSNIEKEAETLESIKDEIIKGDHRKDYKINVCYDGAAEYYYSKLMIPLAIFERKLRQLIYLILISLYGVEWINKLIPKENIGEFKTNNYKHCNKFVEMGLECFTFQNYIDYLFEPRNPKSIEEIIKEVNNENEKEGVTKGDIVKIINNNAKKTIWELIECDNKIEFSKDYIEKIRDIRNKVAHNKEITSNEYKEYKEMLNLGNAKLRIGIMKIEDENYINNIFRNIFGVIKSISDSILNDFKTKIELEKMTQSITVMTNIIEQNNKRFENQIKQMNAQVNLMNQIKQVYTQPNQSNQISNIINPINQSLYLKNFNTVYKDENREEDNKDNENKIDND